MKAKFFTRRLSLILALVMAVCCLTACGGSSTGNSAGAPAAQKDTLTVVADSDVGSMSPLGNSVAFTYMQDQVYETLYCFGYNMQETPKLAKSWDKVDDTHYTFHLREGLKDSAGNPITASDVIFSMELYSQDASYSQYVSHIDFEKTVATDDVTLDVYFADTNAFAFSQLAGVRVVTKAAWEASADQMVTTPVGSGPYKLKEYVSGSYFTLELNPNYVGDATPTFKEIRFNIVSEPSQRTTQLETGVADIVMNLQSSDVKYIDDKDAFTVDCHVGTQSMTMFFNHSENSVMSSKEMRQGVCYAIDNQAMNVAAYGGYCAPSTAFFSTAMTDYIDSMAEEIYTTSSMEKASALFETSGKKGGTIRIATDGSTQETTIAEVLQSTLMQEGFDVKIDSYDPATIWSVGTDPTQWDLLLMSCAAPSGNGLDEMTALLGFVNFSKWEGPGYDEALSLMTQASNTVNVEERLELTRQALHIVEDEVPAYAIVQIAQHYAFRSDLNFQVWDQASLYCADLKIG